MTHGQHGWRLRTVTALRAMGMVGLHSLGLQVQVYRAVDVKEQVTSAGSSSASAEGKMSRLIESLNEQQALNKCADGYEVYWTENNTYLTASHLREIADELDRRNKRLHEQVMQDVGMPIPDTVCTDFQPDWTMPLSEYARVQKESMPQIKPLVWELCGLEGSMDAHASIGVFSVWKPRFAQHWVAQCNGILIKKAESEGEAKAACEAEYERRVRECLEL